MKVNIVVLDELVRRALSAYGYLDEEVDEICEVILYAQSRGSNQGVVKLLPPGMPRDRRARQIEVVKEGPSSALIDGGFNHAVIAVNRAVDIAINKAKNNGVAVVGVNNISTSSGSIGWYVRRIAGDGLIGIVFAGTVPAVAVEGSSEAVLGTNPMAVGVPTENRSLVLDMSTAAVTYFGLIEAAVAARQLPTMIGFDRSGRRTSDPTAALEGAVTTFDQGPKGSGLSLILQALTGPLIGANFAGIGSPDENSAGHLVMALNPVLLAGREATQRGVTRLIHAVKQTATLPGVSEVLVPGERGDRRAADVKRTGEVEVEDNLYRELVTFAETTVSRER